MSRNTQWFQGALVGVDGFCRTLGFPALFAQAHYGWMEHFAPGALISTTAYAGFDVTQITATSVGTLVMQSVAGGALGLVGGADDGAGIQMQSMGAAYVPAALKGIFFEARIKAADADDIDWVVGLSVIGSDVQGSPAAGNLCFRGADGDAHIRFHARSGGTGNAAVLTGYDLANATWVNLGFWFNGTTVQPYVNNVAAGAAISANVPAVALAITMGMLNGATTTNNVLSVDWVRILQVA